MINKKIEELFKTIEESEEYKKYLKIGEVLNSDKETMKLIEQIKKLQQKSVNMEYNNNPKYKEIDKEIKKKVDILNAKPIYQEYLKQMNNFNNILAESSNNIEKYINSKI
ncbi:MAG: YlbF family regulator [Bacilli bacterium]|nr:YlbF family regulator [Bacilli bacterium]